MLQHRPLVFALAVALAAGVISQQSHAAKKPTANKSKSAVVALACTDFYSEANKPWLAANPMPKSGAVSALGQLTARAQQQQRDLLDHTMQAPQGKVQQLLGDFWASGLDEAAVEKDGAAPVAPLLQRIDAIRKNGDIAPAIAALHQVGIPVAFGFNADIDLRDLDRHLGYFSQGGIGLPDPAYYTRNDADTKALLARYADYMRKILTLTGVAKKDLETQTALALDLETRIARAARPLVDLRDPRNNFAPQPTANLGKQYKNLQLDAFLKAQGINDDTVSLANPALFEQLDSLVGKLKPAQWQAYLRWRVGDAMAPYLSRPWRDASFEFRGKVLLGQTDPAPRWQQVLDAINLAAGPMLGKEYAATYLPDATRKQAELIAGQVRDALIQTTSNTPVLDAAGKAEARKKLERLRIEIGTPKRDLDYSLQPMGRGSFGGNMLIASTWRHNQEMKRIGKGNADRRWDVLPQQPALTYDLAHNRLIVTAAMLQAPALDLAQPLPQQYGAFGALVGHELSHALDERGRHIDADGNVRDWWSPEVASAWATVAAKVTTLYANLPYPGTQDVKVSGSLTRDENLADLAGVELAHAAFQNAQPKSNPAQERQFFTGWAQLWAQQVAADEAQIRAQQDVRAPGQWRANVPLMQQPAFGSAFTCKVGSPMQAKEDARVSVFH
ncbi:MAG TPA: M13 family metallopeptidase [Thermomonas sp.]|jgi:putative endopeptidase|uniref:M13 family metallopeptidase n=1 Tax=Thermomonas sp. TaxID=1971895 RepID=UPI002C38705F|nr:M13 family metallopeptidase [Thermomonas sp.]HOV95415.1 M13 family metallopeptidase [Thermomonas sp.]